METTNEEVMKAMLAEQNRRAEEAKEKMRLRNKATPQSNKAGIAVVQGTTTVGGRSLAGALRANEVDNTRLGNPENIVIGKRNDWDPNKK